jgi:hypothetical protein
VSDGGIGHFLRLASQSGVTAKAQEITWVPAEQYFARMERRVALR